jgi:transposase-like protein
MVLIMENTTPRGTPAKRALAVLDTPQPTEPIPPRRISKKVRAAIDAMVSGQCKRICDAAEKVGLARESLSRALPLSFWASPISHQPPRHR